MTCNVLIKKKKQVKGSMCQNTFEPVQLADYFIKSW